MLWYAARSGCRGSGGTESHRSVAERVEHKVFKPTDEVLGDPCLGRRSLTAGRYLLAAGCIEPSKGHATLLRAYKSLGSSVSPLVIVAQSTALPEVMGDAGLMFTPGEARESAVCLRALLEDGQLGHDFARKGLLRAQSFSWDKLASQLPLAFLNWRQGLGKPSNGCPLRNFHADGRSFNNLSGAAFDFP